MIDTYSEYVEQTQEGILNIIQKIKYFSKKKRKHV